MVVLTCAIALPLWAQEPAVEAAAEVAQAAPSPAPPVDLFVEAIKNPAKVADLGAEIERGKRLLRLGALAQAHAAFRNVLAQDAEHLLALEGLRNTLSQASRSDLLPEVLAALAKVYKAKGDDGMANGRYLELITIAPQHGARAGVEQALGIVEGGPSKKDVSWFDRFRSLLGIFVLVGIAFLMSSNRKKVNFRLVAWGLGLQFLFALLIIPEGAPGRILFEMAGDLVNKILSFTDVGAAFIFGNIYNGLAPSATGGPVMYVDGTSGDLKQMGFIFAFHVLPTIIFFGALMSVLYHLGFIQKIVRSIAFVMTKTMKTSGAESLSIAGNIFVGQTEAPLLIKPYVGKMTISELSAVMVGGFATIAGGVLASYVRFGIDAKHLIAASVMSAPAALVMAKILYPEVETPETAGGKVDDPEKLTANVVDAAAAGATDGLQLAFNVAAMLLAFMALVEMANWLLGFTSLLGLPALSLKQIFGWIFYPISFCMGVDMKDLIDFGNLLGTKIAINEFVAYVDLGNLRATMSDRSFIIGTYALCGFANFSSIGIQIGGISSVAPERRSDLARIGFKAMIGGAFASWLTACIAGILI
jgi:CNT family concentrative nucleoside transporter